MDMEAFQILSYSDKYWEQTKNFIKTNWRENHPFCNKQLFDWQFRGFGNSNKKINSLIMLHDDEIVGFRGFIPGIYQIPVQNKMVIIQGGASAMWTIGKNFRKGRLGLVLQQEALRQIAVMTGAHSEPRTSLLFYRYGGFNILDITNRYVIPLEARGYHQLLLQKVDIGDIIKWVRIWEKCKYSVGPSDPDVHKIARVWEEITFPLRIFSLYRNSEFWRWRYLKSKGFRYLFFGDILDTGLIVARIEEVISDEYKKMNGGKVFRIIEIIPKNSSAWQGEKDRSLIELIQGVIQWAINQGCCAADFYCSTSRFESVLNEVGFKKSKAGINSRICSLALLFQPLTYFAKPVNLFFKISISGNSINPSFEDTYMVKSEGDQDRPNFLIVAKDRIV
jgi:hypothetical protein